MQKILATIDLTKIDKSRIKERTYTNQAGEEITAKEYDFEVIQLKDKKLIKDGGTWKLMKTHFIVQGQTKEEREAKADSVFIGDGKVFENDAPVSGEPLKDNEVPF